MERKARAEPVVLPQQYVYACVRVYECFNICVVVFFVRSVVQERDMNFYRQHSRWFVVYEQSTRELAYEERKKIRRELYKRKYQHMYTREPHKPMNEATMEYKHPTATLHLYCLLFHMHTHTHMSARPGTQIENIINLCWGNWMVNSP